MKLHSLYKHVNCTDTAIYPEKCIFIPEKKGYKFKISWYNIVNPNNVYPIGITETIFIKTEDLKNWEEYK